MAFKRNGVKTLLNSQDKYFSSTYAFNKVTGFKPGHDVYLLLIGLENGFYETPCHKVNTHTINGKTVGFNGSMFATYIKCKGIDSEGNLTSSLCCTLAKMERDRLPETNDSAKRIISSRSNRVQLPVLILGNSLNDDSKVSYPISKVALKKDLASEKGLKFAYLDMAVSTFRKDILQAFGKKLKEDGVMDYDMDENSEEFMLDILKRLSETIIKIHGGNGASFGTSKEYSFFPFSNPVIANGSGEGERELIVGYKESPEVIQRIDDFLGLFDSKVDEIIRDWTEKDLQEYYNSAIGVALDAPIEGVTKEEEEVVVKKEAPVLATVGAPATQTSATSAAAANTAQVTKTQEAVVSDAEVDKIIEDPFSSDLVNTGEESAILEDYEYDPAGGDEFFDE